MGGSGSGVAGPEAKVGRVSRLPGPGNPGAQRSLLPFPRANGEGSDTRSLPFLLVSQDTFFLLCGGEKPSSDPAFIPPGSSPHLDQPLQSLPSPLASTPTFTSSPPTHCHVQAPVIAHLVGCDNLLTSPVSQASPFLTIPWVLPDEVFQSRVLLTSCTCSEIFVSTLPQTSRSTVYKQGHVRIHNLIVFGSCLSAYRGPQSLPSVTPSSSRAPQGSALSL